MPDASTPFSLCIYDRQQLASSTAVPAGAGWRALSTGGFRYLDTADGAGGTHRVLLDPRRGRITLNARRDQLAALPLPFAAPVDVAVQWVRRDTGTCWESRYGAAETRRNDMTTFVAMR